MESCNELIQEEVVKLSFYELDSVDVDVPFGISNIEKLNNVTFGKPILHLSNNVVSTIKAEYDLMFDGFPNIKRSTKREASGRIHIFDISVNALGGTEDLRKAENQLSNIDFIVVAETADAKRYMLYTLPNTSVFGVEDQMGEMTTQNIKVQIKSLSSFIPLL